MMTIISGVGLLLLTLAVFSIFSLKFPKGSQAMSGMANAAVASFLIEAVHKYITGDLLGIAFLGEVGATAGSLGGVAAGIMVPLSMGVNPVFAVVGGLACGGYGMGILEKLLCWARRGRTSFIHHSDTPAKSVSLVPAVCHQQDRAAVAFQQLLVHPVDVGRYIIKALCPQKVTILRSINSSG